ncbi:MAG: hypothetical protein V2A34_02315 [Lentisphaerota bacterium]
MHLSDLIQLLILAAMTASVLFMAIQTRLQNRLLRAQLLRDRLDLYWKTYDPITEEQLQQFNDYPEDYFMNRQEYEEHYKGRTALARRHIQMSMLYEYMAFTYELKSLSIGDPLGQQWMKQWTCQLIQDGEFLKVHQYFRGFYPHYEAFVDHHMPEEHADKKS